MTPQSFQPKNPNYAQVIQESFANQGLLHHIGATLVSVEPGRVIIELPITAQVSQQHGFVHAGATTAVVDTACGYAAMSLMPPDTEVLTVEYKVNLMAPAQGEKLIAVGEVMKPGRTMTVCRGDVFMEDAEGNRKICATMLTTMISRQP